jgi:hypothetical protein
MTDTFTVLWGFMGGASHDAMKAANAVSNVMESRKSIELTQEVLEAAAERLGGDWDAESVESMLTHCSFEVVE